MTSKAEHTAGIQLVCKNKMRETHKGSHKEKQMDREHALGGRKGGSMVGQELD